MLRWLGIEPSYSRPRVSDDNSYAEAVFRRAKYRSDFPVKDFADLDTARDWATRFVHGYNNEHRHSGIKYVTQRNAIPSRIARFSRPSANSTCKPAGPTRADGAARPATGRRSRRSRSIQNAIPSSRRLRPKASFPVRPTCRLSRPDLTMLPQRRATQDNRGTQPPRATFGASRERMASTGPCPKRAPQHTQRRTADQDLTGQPGKTKVADKAIFIVNSSFLDMKSLVPSKGSTNQ